MDPRQQQRPRPDYWDQTRPQFSQNPNLDHHHHQQQQQQYRPSPQSLPPLRLPQSHQYSQPPPSPISFAAADRELHDNAHQSRYAFLNGPPPTSPIKTTQSFSLSAKSTFSADDDRSSVKAKPAGSKKILKRVMKELTGGANGPMGEIPGAMASSQKIKAVTYGRSGAGRVKKAKPPTSDASKSVSSLALSDDMKSLKSASSSAAIKKQPVFDPYLKTLVGPRGIPITAPVPPSVATSIPPPFEQSFEQSYASQSSRSSMMMSPPSATSTSLSRSMTGSTNAGSAYTTAPSSQAGWEGDGVMSESGSLWSNQRGPLSPRYLAREESGPMTAYPAGSYAGPAHPGWGQHPVRDLGRHRSSEPALRLAQQRQRSGSATSYEPAPAPPPLGVQRKPSLTPTPENPSGVVTPDLQALYASLLGQQAAGAAAQGPSPIIPHQMAGNLESIFAAAAAYHQLASTLAAAAVANNNNSNTPTPIPSIPVAIPPTARADDATALTAALASYNIQPQPTTHSNSSSPGSSSALSPPPRHRQVRLDHMRKSGHGASSSSSPEEHTPTNTTTTRPLVQTKKNPAVPTVRHPPPPPSPSRRLMTPPPTDDENRNHGRRTGSKPDDGFLSSTTTFTPASPSPVPSDSTFYDDSAVHLGVGDSHHQHQQSMLPYRRGGGLGSRSTGSVQSSLSSHSMPTTSESSNPPPPPTITQTKPPRATEEHRQRLRAAEMDTAREVARLEMTLRELSQLKHQMSSDSLGSGGGSAASTSTTPIPRQRLTSGPKSRDDEEYQRRKKMALPPLPPPPPPASSDSTSRYTAASNSPTQARVPRTSGPRAPYAGGAVPAKSQPPLPPAASARNYV